MSSSDQHPHTVDPAIPETGPWGAVHTARPLGERVWQVTAACGAGLVIEAGETYEIDPPLQPPGPVTDTGGRELRWVPEGVGADVVRLYFSGWGRIELATAERERLAGSIALRAPAEWLMTLDIRRRALPDAGRDPLLAGLTAAHRNAPSAEPPSGPRDLPTEGLGLWSTAEHALPASDAEIAELIAWAPQILVLADRVQAALAARQIPSRLGPLVLAAALYRAILADGGLDEDRGLAVLDAAAVQLRRMMRTSAPVGAYLWLSRFAPAPPPGAAQPDLFTVDDPTDHDVVDPPITVGAPSHWGTIVQVGEPAVGIVFARTAHRRLLALSVARTLELPPAVLAMGTVAGGTVWFTWPDAAAIRLFYGDDLGLGEADRDRIELELARHDERAWHRWRRWAADTDPRTVRGVFGAPLVPGSSVAADQLSRGQVIMAAGEPMIVTAVPRAAAAEPDRPVVVEVRRPRASGPVALIIPPGVAVDTARVDVDRIRIVGPVEDRADDWVEEWELRGPKAHLARVRLWRDDRSGLSVDPDPAVDPTARILVEHLLRSGVIDRPVPSRAPRPIADRDGPVYVYRGAAGVVQWRRSAGPG